MRLLCAILGLCHIALSIRLNFKAGLLSSKLLNFGPQKREIQCLLPLEAWTAWKHPVCLVAFNPKSLTSFYFIQPENQLKFAQKPTFRLPYINRGGAHCMLERVPPHVLLYICTYKTRHKGRYSLSLWYKLWLFTSPNTQWNKVFWSTA